MIFAIMGGDGSLARVVQDMKQDPVLQANIHKIAFTLLPYGTGNDLA